jgi:general secretion pathway protein A
MYESYYGLKEKPFNLLPDPDYLYMSQGHENAYTHLEYAIAEHKGFVVITGEIGSGKTTLINFLLRKIQQNIHVGLINHTDVSPTQFIRLVCEEFEIEAESMDKTARLEAFNQYLLEKYALKSRVVLIIDEAQNLPQRTMEEIRMLSNLESEKDHLIQMIMLGQPELKSKLQRKGLAQFAQRVTVHCHLNGLSRGETGDYIVHRLRVAGARDLGLFSREAIDIVHEYSRGIPRIINTLCDTALVYGFADEQKLIDKALMETVVLERKEAGMLTLPSEEEKNAVAETPKKASSRSGLEKRMDLVEKRLLLLEHTIMRFDDRLTKLTEMRDGQNGLVLELFKMLKQSLESRMRLLLKLLQLSRKIGGNKNNRSESLKS